MGLWAGVIRYGLHALGGALLRACQRNLNCSQLLSFTVKTHVTSSPTLLSLREWRQHMIGEPSFLHIRDPTHLFSGASSRGTEEAEREIKPWEQRKSQGCDSQHVISRLPENTREKNKLLYLIYSPHLLPPFPSRLTSFSSTSFPPLLLINSFSFSFF